MRPEDSGTLIRNKLYQMAFGDLQNIGQIGRLRF